MRKALSYIMSKNASCVSLILLLIASMTIASVNAPPDLEGTIISLNPLESTVLVGDSFTIDVNITDVISMGSYEFKLSYNTTLLDAVEVIPGPASENVSTWLPKVGGVWTPINDALGRVWVGAIIEYGKEFFGSGTLVTINFTATEIGNCTLQFYDTEITDEWGIILPLTSVDGSVTVIPKPPLPLISLNPLESTVLVGDSFTIDVNITDVIDLRAWEFKLAYNTTILDAVYVSPSSDTQICTDWLPVDGGVWHPDGPPTIDDALGRVWTGATFPSGQEFTGSGTLVTINFTATAAGNCTLHLYDTMLADSVGNPIDHDVGPDCSVTVLPKPPLPLIPLNPLEYTVLVGDSFIIDVNITDVTNLQGYEFKLWFNPTLLNATDVIPGPINPPGTVFIPDPLQNVSDGFVWAGASLPTGQPFTGSGILMTINFTALTAGECTLHLNETVLTDPMEVEINHLTLDGHITVLSKIEDCHTDHLNDPTDDFPNDYAPMVIPVNGKNVILAPAITCTCLYDIFEPHYHPCKLAQTLFIDSDWSDKDANYTYLFEDWTDYDWNDIIVSLYAITDNIMEIEIHLEYREAAWKNPFSVEITPEGLTIEVHWNSTDYPDEHIVKMNSGETVNIELFPESNPCDFSLIIIIPLIPPVASFVYSPLHPQVCENVTFNASASTPNGGDIVSYEWDFGDDSLHEFGMVATHHYTTAGTYTVTLNVTDSQGMWDTESKMITVTPRTYTLTITSTAGGTTNPVPGSYSYEEGTIVSVTAIPDYPGYVFDHWELDGVDVGADISKSVTMDKDHTLRAVFEKAPAPPPPVGGHAVPIDKSHFLAPEIGLAPRLGLAFVLLAAMAVTIILIRRRNKTLKRGH